MHMFCWVHVLFRQIRCFFRTCWNSYLFVEALNFMDSNYDQIDILNIHNMRISVDNNLNSQLFTRGYGFWAHSYFITRSYMKKRFPLNFKKSFVFYKKFPFFFFSYCIFFFNYIFLFHKCKFLWMKDYLGSSRRPHCKTIYWHRRLLALMAGLPFWMRVCMEISPLYTHCSRKDVQTSRKRTKVGKLRWSWQ